MARPVCVHCGKPYGHRHAESHQVRWPLGEDMPPYRGNRSLLKVGFAYQTMDRAARRGVTMLSPHPLVRAKQEADIALAPEKGENVATLWTWDGETYVGGYEPFCTLRCALDYARHAYNRSI